MSTKERRLCFYYTHSILDPSYPPVSALAIEGTVEYNLWTRGCQSQRLEAETSPGCQISNMIQSPSVCSEIMRWMKFILQLALANVRCECEWRKEQKQGQGAWSARKVTAPQRNEPRKEHRKEDTSIHEKLKGGEAGHGRRYFGFDDAIPHSVCTLNVQAKRETSAAGR